MLLKVLKENYPTPEELACYRTAYQITKICRGQVFTGSGGRKFSGYSQ